MFYGLTTDERKANQQRHEEAERQRKIEREESTRERSKERAESERQRKKISEESEKRMQELEQRFEREQKRAREEFERTVVSRRAKEEADGGFLDTILGFAENIPGIGGAVKFIRGLFN
jgi:hypothetical protein